MPSAAVWSARARVLFPGLLACGVVAAAASLLSQHYVGLKPVLLMAGETIFLVALVLAMVRWAA